MLLLTCHETVIHGYSLADDLDPQSRYSGIRGATHHIITSCYRTRLEMSAEGVILMKN
jgi:hypothetical protein